MMESSMRAFYEYPPSHANMPARDYGGTVAPVAKTKRSFGDFLKFRSRTKERQLSPVNNAHPAPSHPPAPPPNQASHSYMAEYWQKYGPYNGGTVGRTSYQAMTVVKSLSPPPLPAANSVPKGYPKHQGNGYMKHSGSGTVSAATRATMSSTVRYTDWFGSVVSRRPPVRPALPSFAPPPAAAPHPDKGAPWDHYVTMDPVYDAPRVVPVQLYTNVCLCPDQMLNTKGRSKKKKCKRCGNRMGTVRHGTTNAISKSRPALPLSMYQPAPMPAAVATQHAWGWQVLEERVYEHCEVATRSYSHSPARTLSDEDESPPPTPETVRSVRSYRSARSVKSSDSSATITRDTPEPSRPAPQLPPTVRRALPPTPVTEQSTQVVNSAKEQLSDERDNSRNSILIENPSAYQLISRYKHPNENFGSDTDDLSDNAIDAFHDEWDSESSPLYDNNQGKQVNVISIGDSSDSSPKRTSQSNGKKVNRIRITTSAVDQSYNVHNGSASSDDNSTLSSRSSTIKSYSSDSYRNNSSNKSLESPTFSVQSSNKTSSSAKSIPSTSKTNINSKKASPSNKSSYSSNKNNLRKAVKNNQLNDSQSSIESCTSPSKKSSNQQKEASISNRSSNLGNYTSSQMQKEISNENDNSSGMVNGMHHSSMKKLHDSSELQQGGNTVRIAGQRMFVLGPGSQQHTPNSGFSSGEEDDATADDDTSDYPVSSPTTTHGSDTDTLPEDDDLPLDTSTSSYNSCNSYLDLDLKLESCRITNEANITQSERWATARDTIYEEEEEEVEECHQNQNCTDAYEDSTVLEDEEEKDMSISSSSTSSPVRNEGPHPTLSELLKVKSILKKPPSVDTSSETDSDFYLPTFSEFRQNQRKKKQVQFRSSHEVTVIEDAGESKGRKVSSVRNSRRDREKAKEKQKNGYNLISDLQDIYSRGNLTNAYRSRLDNDYDYSKTGSSEVIDNVKSFSEGESTFKDYENNQIQYSERAYHSDGGGNGLHNVSDGGEWDVHQIGYDIEGKGDQEEPSLHRSLDTNQTPNESTSDFQDRERSQPVRNSKSPLSTFSTPSPPTNVPTRQAPPPPKSRTMSPPRPNVPPPPPPTSSIRSPSVGSSTSSLSSPRSRPLPSPPMLTSSPPPVPMSSPPPSPTPPPLPTSPPPELDDDDNMAVIVRPIPDNPSKQNPTFLSFKSDSTSLSHSVILPTPLPKSSLEKTCSTSSIREVLPPMGPISVFGTEEEARTATIRGRGAAHTRPSILSAFSPPVPDNTTPSSSSASSPPTAPRRRNRNRSLSPETSDNSPSGALRPAQGRGRRTSFLNSLVGDENPYDQITDHIYEELLSSYTPTNNSCLITQSSPKRSPSPHKSPSPGKSMFEGASKYEILEYLQDARRRVAISAEDEEEDIRLQGLVTSPLEAEMDLEDEEEDQMGVEPPEDHFTVLTSRNRGHRSSNMSSNSDSSENSGLLRSDKERPASGEVERTDSGVGSETSKPSVIVRRSRTGIAASRESDLPLCDDCDSPVDTHVTNSGVVYAPLVCRRCSRRRQERKEILTEIMETEIKYGRDLRVMIDEFYRPILVAGLLSRDQLSEIFLNVEELLEHNRNFSLQLRDALEIALDQGDEDLLTVNVAKIFLHAAPMLHAFENYCVRHGSASLLLQTLEKEKELLRIFLKVSQMENTLLRRMNLHSFLMVPVQRVTKYPLLLARLYKTTPPTHPSREDCRRAKEKIELHLQHMNNETKEVSPTKLWRRISMSVGSGTPLKRSPQPHDHTTNLKLRKLALEVLEWPESARVVREGRLFCLAPDSNNWTRRGRTLKMASVHVLLITQGTPRAVFEDEVPEDGLVTPRDLGIKDAAVLAFKDHKVSKAALIRQEPWLLSRCVIAWETEGETECFEVTDLNSKDTFIFRGSDSTSTETWFRYIQFHALSVGMWKRRRPALANIMINGMHRS